MNPVPNMNSDTASVPWPPVLVFLACVWRERKTFPADISLRPIRNDTPSIKVVFKLSNTPRQLSTMRALAAFSCALLLAGAADAGPGHRKGTAFVPQIVTGRRAPASGVRMQQEVDVVAPPRKEYGLPKSLWAADARPAAVSLDYVRAPANTDARDGKNGAQDDVADVLERASMMASVRPGFAFCLSCGAPHCILTADPNRSPVSLH